jgi:uncharacterized protein
MSAKAMRALMRGACAALVLSISSSLAWAGGSADLPAQVGMYSVPVTSLKEMRLRAAFRTTIRQQEDFSCGSAAIATLLTFHYQSPISERAVLEAMYAKGDQAKIRREGFSLLDMKRYLESRGYRADGFKVPLDMLAQKTTPAIVLVRDNGFNHFVVVKGLHEGKVLIGDPALGTRTMARAEFESRWQNGLVFVIHNQPGVAQFNNADHWALGPRAPLEQAVSHENLAAALARFGPGDF